MSVLLLASEAVAEGTPKLPAGYTCEEVRESVQKYGYYASLIWARLNGATKEQIRAAKHCLK